MNPLKVVTASLALAAMPVLAHADDMSYRYFQVGYLETDIPDTSKSLDGFGTRGSFGFADNFFLFTEYSNQEASDSGFTVSIDQLNIGLGGHYPLTDNLDLVGRAGYASITGELRDSVGNKVNADENGYLAAVALRGRVGEKLQLEAGYIYEVLGDSNDQGAELAVRYHFTSRWAAAVEYQDVGDFSTVMAGVRISF